MSTQPKPPMQRVPLMWINKAAALAAEYDALPANLDANESVRRGGEIYMKGLNLRLKAKRALHRHPDNTSAARCVQMVTDLLDRMAGRTPALSTLPAVVEAEAQPRYSGPKHTFDANLALSTHLDLLRNDYFTQVEDIKGRDLAEGTAHGARMRNAIDVMKRATCLREACERAVARDDKDTDAAQALASTHEFILQLAQEEFQLTPAAATNV